MDAPSAESNLGMKPHLRWLARERAAGRLYRYAVLGILAVLVTTAALSAWLLSRGAEPGTFLRESELATAMGVSRTPVREALGRLASEGYLERIAHRGFRVPGQRA